MGTFLEAQSLPSSETVGIAIGDNVLPDPLPVLCIRHYLRRNTPREIAPPVIVVGRMNEIVYDCCRERSCLSCFYAQYTPKSRVLRYVNAGHDAPVLIRRNPEEVLLLEGGRPRLWFARIAGVYGTSCAAQERRPLGCLYARRRRSARGSQSAKCGKPAHFLGSAKQEVEGDRPSEPDHTRM